ncbi:MAG: hypothetical protein KDD37_07250 [Bdellovibrionales bacterium]|nr:hypothetical protein [Bdellovibrionales bacterium]
MKTSLYFLFSLFTVIPALASWMPPESVTHINETLKNYCVDTSENGLVTIGTTGYMCTEAKISQLKITNKGRVKDVVAILNMEIKAIFADHESYTGNQVIRVDTSLKAKCRLNTTTTIDSFMSNKTPSKISKGFQQTINECVVKSICVNKGICASED